MIKQSAKNQPVEVPDANGILENYLNHDYSNDFQTKTNQPTAFKKRLQSKTLEEKLVLINHQCVSTNL